MPTVEIIPPNITPEENQRRIKEIERVLSNLLKRKVTVFYAGNEPPDCKPPT